MKPPLLQLRSNQLASGTTTHAYYLYAREFLGMKQHVYATWLTIDSFNWGGTGVSGPGGASRRDSSDFSDIVLHTPAVKGSIHLRRMMEFMLIGKHLDEVLLDAVGEKGRVFRIEMKDVLVASYASGKDIDTFSLNFRTIKFING